MSFTWKQLNFWQTGEYQAVYEKLADIRKARKLYNPSKENIFRALKLTQFEDCKVMFCGQDPYPDHELATGLAFSIPAEIKHFPPTLNTIFSEYESDLHLPRPKNGSLEGWAQEGVLLWNVVPTCLAGHSLSHDWSEWYFLTSEIIKRLGEKGTVFVFLGSRARDYASLVSKLSNCKTLETSHPSPRGSMSAKIPFLGSRIFSKTNDALNELGSGPVNWRLP